MTVLVLRLLDSQYATANMYVNKGAPVKYDNDAVQVAKAEQNSGYLVLDNVDFGEVSIMLVSCVN